MTAIATLSTAAVSPTPQLCVERREDRALVEGLVARAFGPGRLAKTAERLREGAEPILDLSFVAWLDGRAVGCVRLWSIRIGETSALLLGPFAVEAEFRKHGLGAALIRAACAAADKAGHEIILLVGDEPFFGPLGFHARLARDLRLPGPVDPRRLLARERAPVGAGAPAGMVRAG